MVQRLIMNAAEGLKCSLPGIDVVGAGPTQCTFSALRGLRVVASGTFDIRETDEKTIPIGPFAAPPLLIVMVRRITAPASGVMHTCEGGWIYNIGSNPVTDPDWLGVNIAVHADRIVVSKPLDRAPDYEGRWTALNQQR